MKQKKKRLSMKDYKKFSKRLDKIKYENWRQQVIERDDSRCVVCKKKLEGRKINIHHAICARYKALRTDILNGVVLCAYCHRLGKNAAHQNSIFFALFLEAERPNQYAYLREFMLKHMKAG